MRHISTNSLLSRLIPDHHSDCTDSSHTHTEASNLRRLQIRYFPDDILNKVCLPVGEVTPEIQQLAKDMIFTMMCEKGVGLAAPQVGHLIRLFVVDVDWVTGVHNANPYVMINPTYEPYKGLEDGDVIDSMEGCLSFPGASARVQRYKAIRVTFTDLEGSLQTIVTAERLGVAIQHEMSHLDGETIKKALSFFEREKALKNIKKATRGGLKVSTPSPVKRRLST